RRSPDGSGNSNLHLAAFQKAWREEMESLGLTPGDTPGRLSAADGENVAGWFGVSTEPMGVGQ
ncbi:MAG: hypothetical protein KGZ25_10580, partial [Planctomycetes bacterium]|nr:hypothetical protein [Planctomycetota bacterium]